MGQMSLSADGKGESLEDLQTFISIGALAHLSMSKELRVAASP